MSSEAPARIEYPYWDGEPMADNMAQARWMVLLWSNLDTLLDCFVGMNNFWYPVEGDNRTRLAPDVYVAFGRPKGHRDSYKQWEEGDVPVTVVFEILSPSNTDEEMANKHVFHEEHGAEEYYVFDPSHQHLSIYVRRGSVFRRIWKVEEFRSPRMGISFDLTSGPELIVRYPDGRPFLSLAELTIERQRAETERQRAETERQKAVEERQQADVERQQAEARLARVLELSRKVRRGLASADELAELERLEE